MAKRNPFCTRSLRHRKKRKDQNYHMQAFAAMSKGHFFWLKCKCEILCKHTSLRRGRAEVRVPEYKLLQLCPRAALAEVEAKGQNYHMQALAAMNKGNFFWLKCKCDILCKHTSFRRKTEVRLPQCKLLQLCPRAALVEVVAFDCGQGNSVQEERTSKTTRQPKRHLSNTSYAQDQHMLN